MTTVSQIVDRAVELSRLGRDADSIALLERGWSEFPDEPYLAVLLGMALAHDDPTRAARVLHDAMTVASDDASALLQCARGFSLIAAWDDVEAALAAATPLLTARERLDDSTRAQLEFLRGRLTLERGRPADAIVLLECAHAIDPGIDAGASLAEAYAVVGDLGRARAIVTEGLALRPNHEYLANLSAWLDESDAASDD